MKSKIISINLRSCSNFQSLPRRLTLMLNMLEKSSFCLLSVISLHIILGSSEEEIRSKAQAAELLIELISQVGSTCARRFHAH